MLPVLAALLIWTGSARVGRARLAAGARDARGRRSRCWSPTCSWSAASAATGRRSRPSAPPGASSASRSRRCRPRSLRYCAIRLLLAVPTRCSRWSRGAVAGRPARERSRSRARPGSWSHCCRCSTSRSTSTRATATGCCCSRASGSRSAPASCWRASGGGASRCGRRGCRAGAVSCVANAFDWRTAGVESRRLLADIDRLAPRAASLVALSVPTDYRAAHLYPDALDVALQESGRPDLSLTQCMPVHALSLRPGQVTFRRLANGSWLGRTTTSAPFDVPVLGGSASASAGCTFAKAPHSPSAGLGTALSAIVTPAATPAARGRSRSTSTGGTWCGRLGSSCGAGTSARREKRQHEGWHSQESPFRHRT